ncbi:hypothetical protein DPMN_016706 [Dreissena polymorpha]|uniref:Uncharacterized protein n=1 Tax=Dreissena polymorpha TaxID=45954 RepID=A0A9D4NDV7_DREPO|nr:hypothetical protein DPMN_016706 [Dreissena polymorpha]
MPSPTKVPVILQSPKATLPKSQCPTLFQTNCPLSHCLHLPKSLSLCRPPKSPCRPLPRSHCPPLFPTISYSKFSVPFATRFIFPVPTRPKSLCPPLAITNVHHHRTTIVHQEFSKATGSSNKLIHLVLRPLPGLV